MSPRAALRLEHLGFQQVHDYVPGKTDWMAAGLPREGQTAERPFYAGDVSRQQAPTCLYTEQASPALDRMRAEGQEFCVVTDENNVVLGLIESKEPPTASPDATVADVMRPGPTTVRANEPLQALLARMQQARVGGVPVTDPRFKPKDRPQPRFVIGNHPTETPPRAVAEFDGPDLPRLLDEVIRDD